MPCLVGLMKSFKNCPLVFGKPSSQSYEVEGLHFPQTTPSWEPYKVNRNQKPGVPCFEARSSCDWVIFFGQAFKQRRDYLANQVEDCPDFEKGETVNHNEDFDVFFL